MPVEKSKTNDKNQIKEIIDDLFAATCARDIKRMMSHYAADVIIFDCKPPFQLKGAVTWRHVWEASMPFFPDSFKIETRDVTIHVNGDVAIAHFLFRLKGMEKDHPAMQTWMRVTSGYKRLQGKWKIVHEHGSLPYNPYTMQAVSTLDV